jgi:hypothetical protein
LRSSSALHCRFRRVVCVLVGGTNRTGGEHLSAWLPCASQSKRKASAQDEYSSALPFCPAPALLFRHRTGTSHVLHKSSVWPSCERASHAYRFHIVSKKKSNVFFSAESITCVYAGTRRLSKSLEKKSYSIYDKRITSSFNKKSFLI